MQDGVFKLKKLNSAMRFKGMNQGSGRICRFSRSGKLEKRRKDNVCKKAEKSYERSWRDTI